MVALTRIIIAIGVLCSLTPWICNAQIDPVVDGVAAIVNDEVITYSEVKDHCAKIESTLRETYSGRELVNHIKEERLKTLKSLIEESLIIQDFNAQKYFIPQSVIDDQLKDFIQRNYDGDRTSFTRTLQANGMSLEQFKKQLRDDTIVRAMRGKNVTNAVIISPYKIEQYYQENVKEFTQDEEIKVSIILLRKPLFKEKRKNSRGEIEEYDPQEELAKELLFKINTGADFAELARAYSDGKNREKGGDWGWVSKKDLRQEIVDAVSKLQPGQTSPIIETDDGYYIVRLEDYHRARVQALDEVRKDIERILIQQRLQDLQDEWLNGLRAKAYIKMF